MSKKKLYLSLTIMLFALAICGALYLFFDKKNTQEESDHMQEIAYENADSDRSSLPIDDVNEESSTELTVDHFEDEKEEPKDELAVNVTALQNANPDIFAWITIPGTVIDYPIVQHPTDDFFYLKHGADGMNSSYGCPYIELDDSKDLTDFNTVVYGHNMNDGSMFAALHSYEDNEFYKEHREINVYTTEHHYSYYVFAAVMYSDDRIPYYYDDAVVGDRIAFLQSLKNNIVEERSYISDDVEVGKDDRIITLSTCDKKLRDKRFLVVGVLTKIDGTDIG